MPVCEAHRSGRAAPKLDEAIRGNLQARAAGIVQRYRELGHESRSVFDLLRKYAISEDEVLHAKNTTAP